VAKRDQSIPTGRLRRTARVGGLISGQAAKAYGTKARNLTRSGEERAEAALRRQVAAAEEIVEVLGNMKGAAMKVGQIASFIDTGPMPPEAKQRFQAKLAELRDQAPKVSFSQMRKVIEEDLGERLGNVFADFDEEAIAAASIGQVYRAELRDGRRVAVKVQYPGVARAVRADLQNLGLILRAMKRMAPGLDAKAMADEVRERVTEELDYENEAQNQRAFARRWRGHPFVVIPDVMTDLSRERVLVSEYVEGTPFEEIKRLDREQRSRFGEMVMRFFFGSLYRTGHFSGDPHPGNFILLADGRAAFLDFGMTKKVSRDQVEVEKNVIRRILEGDAEGVHAALVDMGAVDPEDDVTTPEAVLDHFRDVADWCYEDREVTLDHEYVGRLMIDMGDPRSRHWSVMRRETLPPEAMLGRRMEALVLGVLGALDVRANWHRIVREWLFDDRPSTELGRAEEDFWSSAGGEPTRRTPSRVA
jgi:predicted unusual protein kinase regulating ubiquinone biosynthesis (AarF/ABC1/UbiB family)